MKLKTFSVDGVQVGVLLGALLSFMWFEWWMAVIMTALMVLVAFLLRVQKPSADRVSRHIWIGVGLLFLFLFLNRWYPFWMSSAPLGFDTGIYRFEFFHLFEGLPSFDSGLFPGLPLLISLLHLFGFSLDQLMVGLPVGLSLLLGLMIFGFVRDRWSVRGATLALFLFSASLVQWKAYEMMLLKQLLSLSVLIASVWMLEKRTWFFGLLWAFLILVQPLDGFLLGISMMFLLGVKWNDRELRSFLIPWVFAAGLFGIVLVFLQPDFWSSSWHFFITALSAPEQLEYSAQTGVFLELRDFGFSTGLLFVLGCIGWGKSLRRDGVQFLSVFFVVLVGWVVAGLFFWQRILILLELFLVLFSAQVLDELWSRCWKGTSQKLLMVLVLLALVVPMGFELQTFKPQLEDRELAAIRDFCDELETGEYVMVTDGIYGPWLRGFCPRQRVMAPALFEYDPWTLEEWKQFWIGDEQQQAEVLRRIDHPFYAYVGQQQYPVEISEDLFESLGNGWYLRREL